MHLPEGGYGHVAWDQFFCSGLRCRFPRCLARKGEYLSALVPPLRPAMAKVLMGISLVMCPQHREGTGLVVIEEGCDRSPEVVTPRHAISFFQFRISLLP